MIDYHEMTHCQRVLHRLGQGPLDPLQSWREIGVYRLAARVHDLKAQGHDITKNTAIVENQYGEPCRVAEYMLQSTDKVPPRASPQPTIAAIIRRNAEALFA